MRATGSVRVSWRIPTWATDANSAASTPTSADGLEQLEPRLQDEHDAREARRPTGPQRRRGIGSPSHSASTNGMNSGSE